MRRIGLGVLGALLFGVISCAGPGSSTGGGEFKVAVAMFSHETCTFCPGGDVEVEDWLQVSPPRAGEELLRSGGYVGGFVKMAEDYGDMELVGLTSPIGVFGGSSRSWNTEETFNHFLDLMIQDLEAAMPVDGVYLSLHGAMAVRGVPRPEAEIARRFREVVGPDVPIAASFDLHGNEDGEFLRYADFALTTKRYPHYDAALQGARAARALHMTMNGDYLPTTTTRKPGIITATVLQWTGASPSMDIMERARRWEARQEDVFVSVSYGYPWSDVPDVGATIQVMTNNDQGLADEIADDMNAYFWRVREPFALGSYPLPDEAARIVGRAVADGATPVAVGDHSDRPGDATHILRAFLEAGLGRVLYGTITDPSVLEALESSGASAGDPFDMEIGGFTSSGGMPFRIQGTLRYFDQGFQFDKVAMVEFGEGNAVIITPTYTQITDPNRFRFAGMELSDFDIYVVKSRVHFRRGFDETGFAKTIVVVEAPGPFVGTTYLDALPYEHVELSVLYPFGTPQDRR
jgi:microcystin degradation protein MlrC